MKVNYAYIFISLLALLIIILFFNISDLETQVRELKEQENTENKKAPSDAKTGKGKKIEVADFMLRMQIQASKLFFAGKAGNRPLVDFYLTELEENMQQIADAGVSDKGVDISKNMETFGLQQVQSMRDYLDKKDMDNFEGTYENILINSCNSCHKVTKNPFIQIRVPERPIVGNQVFKASE